MTLKKQQQGPARIVSYSADTGKRNFTLGQDGDSLVFRLRTTGTDDNGFKPSFVAENIFTTGDKQHIVFTYDGNLESIFINGKLIKTTPDVKGDFSNWDKGHYLVFGNESTADRPWDGRLYLVAIYNKSINKGDVQHLYRNTTWENGGNITGMREKMGLVGIYILNEGQGEVAHDSSRVGWSGNLIAKKIPRKTISFGSVIDSQTGRLDYKDILINILGFVPLSFIVYFLFRLKNKGGWEILLLPLIIGGCLSFSVEYLQQFTISRHPHAFDILFNVVGVVMGSSLLYLYLSKAKIKSINKA